MLIFAFLFVDEVCLEECYIVARMRYCIMLFAFILKKKLRPRYVFEFLVVMWVAVGLFMSFSMLTIMLSLW